MSISNIILNMPWWYYLIMFIFTAYYAYRGVRYFKVFGVPLSQTEYYKGPTLSLKDKVIIEYIQEILFKVIITISSFISLYVAVYILSLQKAPFNEISAGTAALLIFLIIWGIIGISGYLTAFIAAGKIPR